MLGPGNYLAWGRERGTRCRRGRRYVRGGRGSVGAAGEGPGATGEGWEKDSKGVTCRSSGRRSKDAKRGWQREPGCGRHRKSGWKGKGEDRFIKTYIT